MLKNAKKLALIGLASGVMFQWGCLGVSWRQVLWTTALNQVGEFLLDNDGIFDLFEDGNVVAAN